MFFFCENIRECVKKSGYFTVRLTVSVYPPSLTVFVNFFCVFFILDYDSMCAETDFTQEKVNFHPTTGIPDFSSYCCSSHSGWIFLK